MDTFDTMSLIYLIALLAFIGPAIFRAQRGFAHGLRNLLFWVIIGLVLAIAYKAFME